jgi:hypothetical protein
MCAVTAIWNSAVCSSIAISPVQIERSPTAIARNAAN